MADESTEGVSGGSRGALKSALGEAASRYRKNLGDGMSKENADAELKDAVGSLSLTNSCQELCAAAWQECMILGRPQAECDAEFDACIVPCGDPPTDPGGGG